MTGENSHETEHAGVATHDDSDGKHDTTTAYTKPGTMSDKHVFDVERAFSGSGSEEGTFVTDRKRSRMGVGTMLKGAWSEWWGKTEAQAKETAKKLERYKPKEAPTVTSVETRTNVILEAAKLAELAPRDDHKVVVEKIRTFAHDAEVETGTPFLVKNAPEKKAPAWVSTEVAHPSTNERAESPHKEAVPTLDLRGRDMNSTQLKSPSPLSTYASQERRPMAQPTLRITNTPQVGSPTPRGTNDVPKKVDSPTWSYHVGESEKPVDKRVAASAPPLPRFVPPPPRATETPTPIVVLEKEVVPPPAEREVDTPPPQTYSPPFKVTEPEPLQPTQSEQEEEPQVEDVRRLQFAEEREVGGAQPFLLALFEHRVLLLGTILVIGVVGGVSTAFVMMRGGGEEEVSALTTPRITPSPIRVNSTIEVTVPTPPSTLTTVLKEAVSRGEGTVARMLPGGATETTLFMLLAPHAPNSFVRNVGERTVVGSVGVGGERAPFIAAPSVTFDVAFAGMLSWEPSLVADLSPLFGTPPKGSMLPKDGVVTPVRFVDETTGGTSIRTLYDASGREQVVYGFESDTLIVTTSKEAFGVLVSNMESP